MALLLTVVLARMHGFSRLRFCLFDMLRYFCADLPTVRMRSLSARLDRKTELLSPGTPAP